MGEMTRLDVKMEKFEGWREGVIGVTGCDIGRDMGLGSDVAL